MAGEAGEFFDGVPVRVDPEAIERELSRFWRPAFSGGVGSRPVSRMCLSNLIICLPNRGAWESVAAILPAIARRYPSRLFVLLQPPEGAQSAEASASISALCQLPEPGGLPVCCEQIMLEAPARDLEALVVPLLVPDLPVAVVALFPGAEKLIEPFLRVADRLIVDSSRDAGETLQFVSSLLERPSPSVRDLAWESTLAWRRVLADLYDESEVAAVGRALRRLELSYSREIPSESPGGGGKCRSGLVSAALLAGWLLSRLGLRIRSGAEGVRGTAEGGARAGVDAILRPEGSGESPGRVLTVRLLSDDGDLLVSWEGRGFSARFETRTACILPRRFPARPEDEVAVIGRALERGSPRKIFAEAARGALLLLGRMPTADSRVWRPESDSVGF